MTEPGAGEQVVVSMLDLLGIGLYNADGTPIRVGKEKSDNDLFLFEPEARGLVNLINAQFADDGWIEFGDFHAVLAHYGYTGSAADLAATYNDLFAAEPDALITQLTAHVDPDVPMTKFAAWLLFVDEFVQHKGEAATNVAPSQKNARAIAQLGPGLILDPTIIAHLMTVAASTQPTITIDQTRVHEGHGAPGPPVDIVAQVHAVAITWLSPFTGSSLIPVQPVTTGGISVMFEPNRTMAKHGELSSPSASTDGNGEASISFTPRIEPAGGIGVVVSSIGVVTATVSIEDVMTQLYGQPALAAFAPISGVGIGQLQIEWHDEPPLLIDFVNTYNLELPHELTGSAGTAGQDKISGQLIVDEDDPERWEGNALAYVQGIFSGEALGKSCSSNWKAEQILQVTGLDDPGSGEMLFTFQPLMAPTGDLGNPTCSTARPPTPDGLYWAPFNDSGVTDPTIGLRFNVAIPRPGFFETNYPVPLQGTGVTGYADWDVRIEFATAAP